MLSLELNYRHGDGQWPNLAEYEDRFPDHVPVVRAVFEEFRQQNLPRKFGKYKLLAKLGGGMGVVYRAYDKQLDRTVALKLIHPRHVPSRRRTDRFLAEAQAQAQLQHPHVVRVYGAGQIHGQHYIEMEFVNRCNLGERIHRQPMAPEQAARCLSTIAQAVHYLHSNRLVHRDLKPQNIILDKDGNPHVADFGLARMLDRTEEQGLGGTILGTASYMAPEQAEGRTEDVDERSDVYGLGAIFYEMLTGRPPHRGRSVNEILIQVRESEPSAPRRINPAIPGDLEAICLRCLEKKRERRYASALELSADLEAFLRGEEIMAQPPGVARRVRRWARRQPALASRLAALTICLVVQLANLRARHRVPDRLRRPW